MTKLASYNESTHLYEIFMKNKKPRTIWSMSTLQSYFALSIVLWLLYAGLIAGQFGLWNPGIIDAQAVKNVILAPFGYLLFLPLSPLLIGFSDEPLSSTIVGVLRNVLVFWALAIASLVLFSRSLQSLRKQPKPDSKAPWKYAAIWIAFAILPLFFFSQIKLHRDSAYVAKQTLSYRDGVEHILNQSDPLFYKDGVFPVAAVPASLDDLIYTSKAGFSYYFSYLDSNTTKLDDGTDTYFKLPSVSYTSDRKSYCLYISTNEGADYPASTAKCPAVSGYKAYGDGSFQQSGPYTFSSSTNTP
jgi:hypothetical protein